MTNDSKGAAETKTTQYSVYADYGYVQETLLWEGTDYDAAVSAFTSEVEYLEEQGADKEATTIDLASFASDGEYIPHKTHRHNPEDFLNDSVASISYTEHDPVYADLPEDHGW